jgi:GntR family transcriptional regulator
VRGEIKEPRALKLAAMNTIYAKMARELELKIVAGQIKQGEAVPSVRRMAQQNATSVATAQKAMGLIVKKGLVERRRGRVFVVAGGKELTTAQRLEELKPAALILLEQAGRLQIDACEVVRLLEKLAAEDG